MSLLIGVLRFSFARSLLGVLDASAARLSFRGWNQSAAVIHGQDKGHGRRRVRQRDGDLFSLHTIGAVEVVTLRAVQLDLAVRTELEGLIHLVALISSTESLGRLRTALRCRASARACAGIFLGTSG